MLSFSEKQSFILFSLDLLNLSIFLPISIYLFSDRGDGGGGVVIVHGGNGSAPVAGKGKSQF